MFSRRTRGRQASAVTQLCLALLALLAAFGTASASADDTIGALGLNDARSDGIMLPNAEWNGAGDLDLMAGTGMRLYRARVRLDCVDPGYSGSFDFSAKSKAPNCGGLSYDDLVRGLADRGMTLLPVLMNFGPTAMGAYTPQPPTVDGAGGTPVRQEFAAFAAAAARRYGSNGTFWATCGCTPRPVKAWEIWNESNNGWWWGGTANAEDYADMFRETRGALRAADPAARAVVGGLVWDRNGQPSFIEPESFVATLARDNANAFDAVAVHPYTDARSSDPAKLADSAIKFIDKMAAQIVASTGPAANGGPRQQIWVTEMGWSDTDTSGDVIGAAFGAFLAQLDAGARARSNVGPVAWYMLRDNNAKGTRDDQLGMRATTATGADLGPKPVWSVFAGAAASAGSLPLPAALADSPGYRAPKGTTAAKPGARPVAGKKKAAAKAAGRIKLTIKATKSGAKVKVGCPKSMTACTGTLKVTTKLPGRSKKGTKVGSAKVKVAAGKSRTVSVTLAKVARKRLAKRKAMWISVTVAAKDAAGAKSSAQRSYKLRAR